MIQFAIPLGSQRFLQTFVSAQIQSSKYLKNYCEILTEESLLRNLIQFCYTRIQKRRIQC